MKYLFTIFLICLATSLFAVASVDRSNCHSLSEIVALLENNQSVCNKSVCIYNLNFDFGLWDLKPQSMAVLDSLIAVFKPYPNISLTVNGHTDSIDTYQSNITLSQNRARVVASYLHEHGVGGGYIAYNGYGESLHIADNATEEGRAKNRRVEIMIQHNCKLSINDTPTAVHPIFGSTVPEKYLPLVNTHLSPCHGASPPSIGGQYIISKENHLHRNSTSSPQLSIWFVLNGDGTYNYYERKDDVTTLFVENVHVIGDSTCFTVFFVKEYMHHSASYTMFHAITGFISQEGIRDLKIFKLMLQKYDPYNSIPQEGNVEIIRDSDGLAERDQWKLGKRKEKGKRPIRKNKKLCPSCP